MKRYAFEGNFMATELTMWIYGHMAILGIAYHALLVRGVTV